MRTLGLWIILALGCGGSTPTSPQVVPPAPAPAAPAPPAPVADPLNLGFEAPLDPGVWTSKAEVALDRAVAHGGSASLRIEPKAGARSSAVTAKLPLEAARGHIVRVHGWIKTRDVSGFAALWCRVDGPDHEPYDLDNMADRGRSGTTEWTAVTAEVKVPPSSVAVVFGGLLVGAGTAWIDDLRIEIVGAVDDAQLTAPLVVDGVVTQGGAPVAGMTVRATETTDDRPILVGAPATTGADGAFHLALPPGQYALVATGPATAGAVGDVDVRRFRSPARVTIPVGGASHVLSGRVVDLHGAPVPRALAGASAPLPGEELAIYLVEADAAGAFRVALPPGRYAPLAMAADALPVARTAIDLDRDVRLDLRLARRAELAEPAPAAVIDWLRGAAIPIATAEPSDRIDDLKPLGRMIGKARLIGLGEATHGTREFSQLKHRMLQYLVREQGVTVFAIEGGFGDLRALDAYVRGGAGDAKEVLARSLYRVWNTEETLALVEWIRAWNTDPAHAQRPLAIYGVDVQTPQSSVQPVLDYLGRVAPERVDATRTLLAPMADPGWAQAYARLPEATRGALHAGVRALLAAFDANRAAWTQQTSARDYLIARKHCDVLRQSGELRRPQPGLTSYDEREQGMAENALWILDEAEPGARVALWAHNGHISRDGYDGVVSVGQRLARRLGRDYVTFGFVWNQGGFGAFGRGSRDGWTREVGPDRPGGLGATFASIGAPLAAVDLRGATGAVATWLASPRRARDIGALFTTEANMDGVFELSRSYDCALFVDRTSAARRL